MAAIPTTLRGGSGREGAGPTSYCLSYLPPVSVGLIANFIYGLLVCLLIVWEIGVLIAKREGHLENMFELPTRWIVSLACSYVYKKFTIST